AHEPIIDRATFDTVQAEIERRANKTTVKKGTATVFTGKIRCGVCGKNYRRKTTKTGFVWICATFNTKGKKFCASKQVPEETLKAVCAEALGTGSFDDDTFAAHIDFITALPDNVLEFHFKDGQTTAVGWQDRSRRESWTDDKRQAAREKATRRND
ncbi:MAG: zinc ribbon domain-containing protein, partial [Oscillospiraceae bacterium]